ncbi:MAG: sulfite exporter TauE/SafE family protein [Pseudomonadota bacterium]
MNPIFEPATLVVIGGIFVLAGMVKGTTGIGLPTAAVGMMSQFMDPRQAIALVVFPSLLSNAWQMFRQGRVGAVLARFWLFIACLMGFIALVSFTVTASVPTETLIVILGCVICLFSVMSLAFSPPVLPARYDRAGQVISGTASGVLGGLTGIWAPPMVTYLMARRIEKEEFVAATGVMIFAGTLPLIGGFWSAGLLSGNLAMVSVMMFMPALIGFTLGETLRHRMDADRFRTVVLVVFLVMGLNLFRKALF